MNGAKRDKSAVHPHQTRWRALGTQIGGLIQRDLLFAEKHFEKAAGNKPRFRFERNDRDEPLFEEFAKKNAVITHGDRTFSLYGTCDGILRYVSDDGEVLRVGLEVKSKQTTASRTSEYTMRSAEEDHVKQAVCYAIMYDVDYYVILYVNAAKKAWALTAEEYAKSPDFKAFGIRITDEMRAEVLDYFAEILSAVDAKQPPALDIDRWTFNNYKTACATSLTTEELAQIERKVSAIQASGLPDWKKRDYAGALAQITESRRVKEAA